MEHFCRMLLSLVYSKIFLYQNLINNITLQEHFNYLRFYSNLKNEVFGSISVQQQYNDKLVFSTVNYREELYFSIAQHYLNQSAIKKLKQLYNTSYKTLANNEVWKSYYLSNWTIITYNFFGFADFFWLLL